MTDNENIQQKEEKTEKNHISENTPNEDFLACLNWVSRAYTYTVTAAAIVVALGITLAVFLSNVVWGLGVAICGVLLYMILTKALLQKGLGISYRSTSGELSVVKIQTGGKEELWIPSRLLGLDVTEIEKAAFKEEEKKLKIIHLPTTLKTIGEDAFTECEALTDIYFEGTEEEWNAIENQASLNEIEIHFCDSTLYRTLSKPKKPKKAKKSKKDAKDTELPSDTEQNNCSTEQPEDENK